MSRLAFALLFLRLAVSAGEPDLQALRAEFAANLATVTLPVLKQQVTGLGLIERKAADARDYDTALSASEERKRLLAIIADQEKLSLLAARQTPAAPDKEHASLQLKLADAQLDRVRFDAAAGVLTDWAGIGASATWKLPSLPAGGYNVILKYESGALEGGSVVVQEKFFTLSADLQTTLKGPVEHRLGVLRIRDGDGIFKITARAVLKGNLMRLQSVELSPVNAATNE